MLEIAGLGVRYGRHRALEEVATRVDRGEICVVLGANGAGKSSLLKAVAGLVPPDPGSRVTMNGQPLARLKPHRIVEAGIALVPEGRGIFTQMTVGENLRLGAFAARARANEAAALARVHALFPRLAERDRQVVRTMSGGEQQMVAIGRALMSNPDILMLDEPSLGLSPLLTRELFRALREVAASGVGILLVEQNARQSLKIADRGYLIENGRVTGEGSAAALASDPAVIEAYLGGTPRAHTVNLPPPMGLPAGLEALGNALGTLADRAARIHVAFTRALRREEAPPSAFAGRYDPKAGADPWLEAAAEPAQPEPAPKRLSAPREVRDLGAQAADLAERAGARLSRHLAARRAAGPVPSAFVPRPPAAVPAPPAEEAAPLPDDAPLTMIGHNSALFDLDALDDAPQVRPARGPAPYPIAALVDRAAAIQAAHVAARRGGLAPFPVPSAGPPGKPKRKKDAATRQRDSTARRGKRRARAADTTTKEA